MAERISSMGSKDTLAKYLSLQKITGTTEEVANTHEINRQSMVKEILLHTFLMSKYGLIDTELTVGEARNQYFRATQNNQAAHCAPGQIFYKELPIQDYITASDDLRLTVENLFARTDDIETKFNVADSRAEENGLRNALLFACRGVAESGKKTRFNRAEQFLPQINAACATFKSLGIAAFRTAIQRQRALMTPSSTVSAADRQETIRILECYMHHLQTSVNSLDTVLGLFPEDVWRMYSHAGH
jgi:hypothetical protein